MTRRSPRGRSTSDADHANAVKRGMIGVCVHVFVWAALQSPGFAADWPWWRGPRHDGTTAERLARGDGEVILPPAAWRARLGEGSGSVVVAGHSVYATGWRDGHETVWCLAAEDGEVRWSQRYACPRYGRFALGDQAMYAGPTATPTLDEQDALLFTLGCDGDLRCWDTSRQGALVWSVNLYDRYNVSRRPDVGGGHRDYGFTTAPLVQGNQLLVAVGGEAGLVKAFDKRTGEEQWSSVERDDASNCGGIAPMRVGDVPCIAVLSLRRLVVMRTDPGHQGETLASYPWTTDFANNLVTPAADGSRILLSSGYNLKKTVMLEIRDGRISPRWESRTYSAVGSPVIFDNRIYFAYRRLHCLDLDTGDVLWRGGEFGPDGSCLITADNYILAYGNGRLVVADAAARSPEAYRERARREGICRANEAWPHVVLAGGHIYCKDKLGNVTCFGPLGVDGVVAMQEH